MYQINWPRAICLPFLFVKRFSILFLHQHNLTKIRYGLCCSEFSFFIFALSSANWTKIVHFVLMINNKLKV